MPPKTKYLRLCIFVQDGDADIFRFVTAMASFKYARNLLLESYIDGIIDEFILLYEGNFSKSLKFPYEDYNRFDLDAMDDTECKAEFRLTKNEIPRLAEESRL